jgi:peptide/nickel transport system permease protein
MIALGALPAFLLAVLLQWCAVQLKDTFGMTIVYVGGMPRDGGVIEYIQRFALPVLVLVLVQVAAWMRFERSQLIDEFESESMQAARARGLPECVLSRRHAMRPTFAPLIALVALELGTLIGGAVVVETIFGLPGIGRLLVDSVQARDVVVVLDIVALGAILMVVVTAVADVVMARLDPRISGPLEGVR